MQRDRVHRASRDCPSREREVDRQSKRALDLSIAAAKSKGSLALSRSMAYHPEIQYAIADMVIELESIGPHLETIAEDWSGRCGSRRPLALKDFCRQVPCGRRFLARRGPGAGGDRRQWNLSLGGL
jgi:hypothetical protein